MSGAPAVPACCAARPASRGRRGPASFDTIAPNQSITIAVYITSLGRASVKVARGGATVVVRCLSLTKSLLLAMVAAVALSLAGAPAAVGSFVAVTGASIRGRSILDSLWVYLAYCAGMALIAGVLAIGVLARSTLLERMRRIVPYAYGLSGGLLVLVGLYVGYYGVYEVRLFDAGGSPRDRVIAAVGQVQGAVAAWVHQHGAWPWVLAIAVLLALATLASVRLRHAHRWFRARRSRDMPVAAKRG
jgi:hypothetical protein